MTWTWCILPCPEVWISVFLIWVGFIAAGVLAVLYAVKCQEAPAEREREFTLQRPPINIGGLRTPRMPRGRRDSERECGAVRRDREKVADEVAASRTRALRSLLARFCQAGGRASGAREAGSCGRRQRSERHRNCRRSARNLGLWMTDCCCSYFAHSPHQRPLQLLFFKRMRGE